MDPNEQEFERLVAKYARLMSGAVRRVCGRRHRTLMPDVEQEIRLALWKRLQDGKGIDHPVSYLYKVALTTALSVLRAADRRETPMDPESLDELPEPPMNPRVLLPVERAQLLTQVLGQLPSHESRALKAYLAGFNHREVSVLYGWSESEARHRIYRGIEKLKLTAKGRSEDD